MPMFPRGVYAILDTDRLGWTEPRSLLQNLPLLLEYARAAVDHGAVAIQLRAKGIPLGHAARQQTLASLREVTGPVPLLVNDDLVAAQAQAVGLHLGQGDGDPGLARANLDAGALLGLSTHTLGQVQAAAALPVDYLGFGPIRATSGKRDHDAVTGLEGLQAAVQATRLPMVAIGGLEIADLPPVREAGAHAAAVIGAWLGPQGAPWRPVEAGRAVEALAKAWRM